MEARVHLRAFFSSFFAVVVVKVEVFNFARCLYVARRFSSCVGVWHIVAARCLVAIGAVGCFSAVDTSC